MVALLACLAAPEGPRPRTRATVSEPSVASAETAEQEVRSCSVVTVQVAYNALQAKYPRCSPYVGYRRDLIATLASLSHGHAGVVREIVSAGKRSSCSRQTTALRLTLGPPFLVRWRVDHCATMSRRRWSVCRSCSAWRKRCLHLQFCGLLQRTRLYENGRCLPSETCAR